MLVDSFETVKELPRGPGPIAGSENVLQKVKHLIRLKEYDVNSKKSIP